MTTSANPDSNPFAVGEAIGPDQDMWIDGDIEFTRQEIRVMGDTELPRICIKTGHKADLKRCEKTIRIISMRELVPTIPFVAALIVINLFERRIEFYDDVGITKAIIWITCIGAIFAIPYLVSK